MPGNKVSQHILDKKQQNRRQIVWSVALATLAVAGMTYYDLKIRDYTPDSLPAVGYHYVGSDAAAKDIPDDNSSLTVWLGLLTPQPDGSTTAIGNPVTPASFPQRQVDLYFGLAVLSASDEPGLVAFIGQAFRAWESQGNLVMDALIDTSRLDDTPAATLKELLATLHSTHNEEYRYTLALDPLDSKDLLIRLSDDERKDLMKAVHGLNIRVTAENAAKAMAAADALGYPFSVAIPAGTDLSTFATDAAAKAKHFTHFIRDLAPPPAEAAP